MAGAMFGPRLTRVFASRWMALWWAATILLLAWQMVPAADENQAGASAAVAPSAAATNPWALSPSDKPAGS
jgi:hypothetical protein